MAKFLRKRIAGFTKTSKGTSKVSGDGILGEV
jgi:hypothetical protein